MARFLTDECFSGSVIAALGVGGFDVERSIDVGPGADYDTVLA